MTRFEESRLETPESSQEASGRPPGGATNTIQPLRHDSSNLSRSQEIINRFRRDRERAGSQTRNPSPATSSYLPWGDIERPERAASALRREAFFEELSSTRHDQELLASQYAGSGHGQQTPLPASAAQEPGLPRLLASHNRIRRPRRIQENLFMSGRSELIRALGRRIGVGDYVVCVMHASLLYACIAECAPFIWSCREMRTLTHRMKAFFLWLRQLEKQNHVRPRMV